MPIMIKKSATGGVTSEKIMEVLLDMDERMATKDDLRNYATKNDLERVKGEILDVLKPVVKAVDKAAVTIVNHGKRISVLERKTGAITK